MRRFCLALLVLWMLSLTQLVPADAKALPAVVDAADCTNLSLGERFGGATRAVDVRDSFVYTGEGSHVVISTLAENTTATTRRGSLTLPTTVRSLQAQGDFVYAVGGEAWTQKGLFVVDVRNPDAPLLVGTLPIATTAPIHELNSIRIRGTTAYVGTDDALMIVDVADPARPTKIGTYAGGVNDLAVQGTTAYLATNQGLAVVDVADPAAPKQLAMYAGGVATDVLIDGTTAYVVLESVFPPEAQQRRIPSAPTPELQLVDVANPVQPTLLGRTEIIDGNPTWAIAKGASRVYVASADELQIVDVDSPATPTKLSPTRVLEDASDMLMVGDTLYVANGRGGLSIVVVYPLWIRAVSQLWLVRPAIWAKHALCVSSVQRPMLAIS